MNANRFALPVLAGLALVLSAPTGRADDTKNTATTTTAQSEKTPDAAKDSRDHQMNHGSMAGIHGHASKTKDKAAAWKDEKPSADAVAKTGADARVTYVCPMHPEVTSDQKGRCPKCNMFLEPKK